ncbi:OmpH family outer membrane protein [Sphingobacteriales bacterium UPWRP_1]|nr:hypothetical protein B6N25_11590 [Sphingobacteriales bacterium TSM_CSS]PSJ72756.1 OmpH family outer membrane protein [Sphingobacteriales bacterium UPWRP_1]
MKSFASRILLLTVVCFTIVSCRTKTPETTATDTPSVGDSIQTDQTPNAGGQVPPPAGIKYGYLNSLQLLALMPETKAADKKIAEYARKKESAYSDLLKKYQTKIQDLQSRANDIPPVEMEKHGKEIAAMEEQLQDMQMRADSDISKEKEKLYEPILAKADSVVKQIGKENGYTFIYDAAALLYADTTLNILPMVKERMGIK